MIEVESTTDDSIFLSTCREHIVKNAIIHRHGAQTYACIGGSVDALGFSCRKVNASEKRDLTLLRFTSGDKS